MVPSFLEYVSPAPLRQLRFSRSLNSAFIGASVVRLTSCNLSLWGNVRFTITPTYTSGVRTMVTPDTLT